MPGRKKNRTPAIPPPAAGDRRRQKGTRANADDEQARIDDTLKGSFPASDPPSWTLGDDRTPEPDRRKS
jgi:hypothetical protein